MCTMNKYLSILILVVLCSVFALGFREAITPAVTPTFGSSGSGSGNFSAPGNCPDGYVVQNTTLGGVQCVSVSLLANLSIYSGGQPIYIVGGNTVYFNQTYADNIYMWKNGTNSNITNLQFNTNYTGAQPSTVGNMRWNINDKTLEVTLSDNVALQIGQEQLLYVKNDEGAVIRKGQVVYVSSASGANVLVKLASASDNSSHQTIGIATEDLQINEFGYITTFGLVRDIDTAGFIEGQLLYLSTQKGNFTNTRPPTPAHTVKLGYVVRANLNNGVILTNVRDGMDLNVLDDVLITNAINNQVLTYNSTDGFWYNSNVSALEQDPRLTAQNYLVADPTGFKDTETSIISFNLTTLNFTIQDGVGNFTYYINGTQCSKTNETIAIQNTTGLHFMYYTSCGNLIHSLTPWGFEGYAQVAIVYLSESGYIIGDERHDLGMDWKTHEYLHNTIGTRYHTGLTGQFTDTTFNITSGSLYDENLRLPITNQTRANVFYRNSSYVWHWLPNQTQYYYKNTTNMYYDNNGVLTPVPANQYMAVWIFGTNDRETPIISIIGQRTDTTIANARANNNYESLSFGTLPFAEYKVLYRIILKNDATPYEETQDLRSVSNTPSGTYVATSHGVLTGLGNNDHTQYAYAGTCPSGYVLQNATNAGHECIAVTSADYTNIAYVNNTQTFTTNNTFSESILINNSQRWVQNNSYGQCWNNTDLIIGYIEGAC